MEHTSVRCCANVVSVTLILLGAALAHAALPAMGATMMLIGMLLLLDLAGAFDGVVPRRAVARAGRAPSHAAIGEAARAPRE
jgi:hypothetical protein